MKPSSRKAKGHALEQWLVDKILETFPTLTTDDIRRAVGSETGADVKMSKKAQIICPYRWEAKNRQTFTTLYGFMEQCSKHEGIGEPVVVLKMNRKRPLVIVDAEEFFKLIKDKNNS